MSEIFVAVCIIIAFSVDFLAHLYTFILFFNKNVLAVISDVVPVSDTLSVEV